MPRADRETWAKRVERWKDSGLSAAEFGAEIGVTPKSLTWWKWQLGKNAVAAAPKRRRRKAKAVSPLTFVEMSSAVQHEPLEIILPSGVRIRVPGGFEVRVLSAVLDALEKRR